MAEKEMLAKVIELREIEENLTKSLKNASEDLKNAETSLMEYMESKEIKSFNIDGLGSASINKPRLYANVKKEDEEKMISFLDECGRGDLVKPTVNRASLSQFVNALLEEGKAVPEFISIFMKPMLSIKAMPSQGGIIQ